MASKTLIMNHFALKTYQMLKYSVFEKPLLINNPSITARNLEVIFNFDNKIILFLLGNGFNNMKMSFKIKQKLGSKLFIRNKNYAPIFKRIRTVILILFFFSCSVLKSFGQKDSIQSQNFNVKTIVIDAGHGGHDPGCIGSSSQEKHVCLGIALKLGKLIKTFCPDVKVIYTRDKDEFVKLHERANIANKNKADLFISIHANANERHHASGFETYLLRPGKFDDAVEIVQRENDVIKFEEDKSKYEDLSDVNTILASMAQNEYIKESEFLASEIQNQLSYVLNIKNRGVKQAGFWVLHKVDMPNVLIELGFLSHPQEELFLASKKGQEKLANHIFEGFKHYKSKYDGVDESLKMSIIDDDIQPVINDEEGQVFKVQLATSSSKISTEPQNFNGLKGVEVYLSGKFYKYTYGICRDKSKAVAFLNEAKKAGYDSAFVVSFENGKRLNWKKL